MTERMDAIMQRLNRQGNDDDLIEAKSGSGKLEMTPSVSRETSQTR
ncbi:hypothetical protein [Corynebacterium sp. Marseille-P4321]|nr:hypothetical protein [Corynebacterium sp. Marseille-P4321]